MARDLVCLYRWCVGRGVFQGEVGAADAEGEGDDEVNEDEHEHCCEGDGATRGVEPEEEVEEEEGAEDCEGEGEGRDGDVVFEVFGVGAVEEFSVDVRRCEA